MDPKPLPETSKAQMNQLAKIEPMIAAALHNLNSNTLYRLPEEILLRIMRHSDFLSLECLKRTCRLFLRLYYDEQFCTARSDNIWSIDHYRPPVGALLEYASESNSRNPWLPPYSMIPFPKPSAKIWTTQFCSQLLACLARDNHLLCPSCRAVQAHKKGEADAKPAKAPQLYCDGCRTYHPRGLFSGSDRNRPCFRTCVGHQGFVRLCCHKTMSWDDVRHQASLQRDTTDRIRLKAFWQEQPLPTGISQPLRLCPHPNHAPAHHDSSEQGRKACKSTAPRARVAYIRGYDQCLVLECRTHVLVPDLTHGIYASELELLLRESRKGAAEFIAPELGPGRLPEMHCFDPNRCSCLRYEGMMEVKGWERAPWSAWNANRCRNHADGKLEALAGKAAVQPKLRTASTRPSSGRCNTHRAEIHTSTHTGCGPAKFSIIARPCTCGNPQCLCFEYQRLIPIRRTRFSAAWFQAIDPDSVSDELDVLGVGSPLCQSSACPNYYRYLRKIRKSFPHKDDLGDVIVSLPSFRILRSIYHNTKTQLSFWLGKCGSARKGSARPRGRQV